MENNKVINEINRMIYEMKNITEEAKNVLLKIAKVASSENDSIKQSLPHLLIVGQNDNEVTEFAKAYESIIKKFHVYNVRGTKTFLELSFPKYATELDYRRFFGSPEIAATTQNKFYGVFLISFDEWDGKDLLRDDKFRELINFVESNKKNISFIFHVTQSFTTKNELKNVLMKYLYLLEIKFEQIEIEQAVECVENIVEKSGIIINSYGKRLMKNLLRDNLSKGDFSEINYTMLETFAKNIQFELCVKLSEKEERKNKKIVTGTDVREAIEGIVVPDIEKYCEYTMGFK